MSDFMPVQTTPYGLKYKLKSRLWGGGKFNGLSLDSFLYAKVESGFPENVRGQDRLVLFCQWQGKDCRSVESGDGASIEYR